MMADYGHEETDRLIKELEEKLKEEYKTAQKDLEKKLEEHLEKYQKQLDKKVKDLADGKIDQKAFDSWKSKETASTIHWKNMVDNISADLLNADKIAAQMINNEELTAFALNHNFATYEIEKGLNVNTSYELVDRETVKNLVKNNPDLLKDVKIDTDKTTSWNKKKINSVILQGTIQGESIPQIAKRLQEVTQSNYKVAVRNARTAMTFAQNSGRMESYYRAEKLGVKMKKAWLATLDGRTRHEHRLLDGQVVGIHESFEVEGEKLECPGDPKASYHLTMNCRCTLVGELEGFEDDFSDLAERNTRHMTESTYEEWKHAKEKESKNLSPEKAIEKTSKNTILRLSDEKISAIREYTSSSYGAVNSYMRGDEAFGTDYVKKIAKIVSEVLRESEIPKEITLYRGSTLKELVKTAVPNTKKIYKYEEGENLKSLIGKEFTNKSFMSTSVGGVQEQFVKGVEYEILAPKGSKGLYIADISGQAQENEVLLGENQTFEIADILFEVDEDDLVEGTIKVILKIKR